MVGYGVGIRSTIRYLQAVTKRKENKVELQEQVISLCTEHCPEKWSVKEQKVINKAEQQLGVTGG